MSRRKKTENLDFSAAPARAWPAEWGSIPGYDPFAKPGDCYFDWEAAEAALAFFAELLQLVEGEHANKPFALEPWQKAIVATLWGWKRPDGTRRYREAFIFVPRKNGKTPLCAGIVLLALFTDGEPGAQIYSAAAEREQASIVFKHANGMICREPELEQRCRVYKTYRSIEHYETNGIYKALSADADTKHGLAPSVAIVDELHAHPDGELADVLETGMASRRQPLMIYITTADYDRPSPCNRKHEYATKVRQGVIDDPTFLPVLYQAEPTDDFRDPAVWAKANPNLGVSVKLDYMRTKCQKAQDEPSYENTFKRLHLNMKTQNDVRWLSLEKWDASTPRDADGKPIPIDEERLAGRRCFAGLDLASRFDVAGYVLLFPPLADGAEWSKWRILPRFFVPADNAERRERRDRVPYLAWAKRGLVTLTPGNVIDYAAIRASILADGQRFNVAEISADRWNLEALRQQLEAEGSPPFVEFGQGFQSMDAPSKELEALIAAGRIDHGGHEMLRWMVSNATAKTDPAGNIKPDKAKSTEKIDGVVMTVMALGRAMVGADAGPKTSDDYLTIVPAAKPAGADDDEADDDDDI